MEKYGRAGQSTDYNKVRHMRIACWIPQATNTLRICNSYCFYKAAIVMGKRLNFCVKHTLLILPNFEPGDKGKVIPL